MQLETTYPHSERERQAANKPAEAGFGVPSSGARNMPTQRAKFLSEMERAMPWAKLRALVEPVYADPKSRRVIQLELDRMLRVHFLQHWFHLSDAAVHDELLDSSAMRTFACVGLAPDKAPGEIAICGFHRLLDENGLGGAIVEAADRHLRAQGFAVSPGVIVDATLARTQAARVSCAISAGATRIAAI